jgi:hypothetical protein
MPGIGDEIEGAMQHAAQAGRQSMRRSLGVASPAASPVASDRSRPAPAKKEKAGTAAAVAG